MTQKRRISSAFYNIIPLSLQAVTGVTIFVTKGLKTGCNV